LEHWGLLADIGIGGAGLKETNRDAMLRCVLSEPDLIKQLYVDRKNLTKDFVKLFCDNPIKKIYFSGQASGMYLGMMLKPMAEDLLGIEATATNPAVFAAYERFNVNGVYQGCEQAMLCPAHSGTTNGPILMAEKCRELGIHVVTTTWDVESPLAKLSDVVIDKRSGKEESFIETKGHIASLTVFFLCFIETAYAKGNMTDDEYRKWCLAFEELPAHCANAAKASMEWYEEHKYLLIRSRTARYIGFGSGYPVALEGGLKIAEAASISALSYEMEEFMHTGTTQIESSSLVFLIAPRLPGIDRMHRLAEWVRAHTDSCVVIGSRGPISDELSLTADFQDKPYIYVLEYLIPFQILAHLTAVDMGLSTITPMNFGAGKTLKTHVD